MLMHKRKRKMINQRILKKRNKRAAQLLINYGYICAEDIKLQEGFPVIYACHGDEWGNGDALDILESILQNIISNEKGVLIEIDVKPIRLFKLFINAH